MKQKLFDSDCANDKLLFDKNKEAFESISDRDQEL